MKQEYKVHKQELKKLFKTTGAKYICMLSTYFMYCAMLAYRETDLANIKKKFEILRPDFEDMRAFLKECETKAVLNDLQFYEYNKAMKALIRGRSMILDSMFKTMLPLLSTGIEKIVTTNTKKSITAEAFANLAMSSYSFLLDFYSDPKNYKTKPAASLFENDVDFLLRYALGSVHFNSLIDQADQTIEAVHELNRKKDRYYTKETAIGFYNFYNNVQDKETFTQEFRQRKDLSLNLIADFGYYLLDCKEQIRKNPDWIGENTDYYRKWNEYTSYYGKPLTFAEYWEDMELLKRSIEFGNIEKPRYRYMTEHMDLYGYIQKIYPYDGFYDHENWSFITEYDDVFINAVKYEQTHDVNTNHHVCSMQDTWNYRYLKADQKQTGNEYNGLLEYLCKKSLKTPDIFHLEYPLFWLNSFPGS